jgi:hypothetical protein
MIVTIRDDVMRDKIEATLTRIELLKSLQQENKQLKEELQKADSITQSCILEGKEESTINFRECLNKLELYKEVIEEVRTYVEDSPNQTSEDATYFLLQILDKVKGD